MKLQLLYRHHSRRPPAAGMSVRRAFSLQAGGLYTHEVFNQARSFAGVDLYLSDRSLMDAIAQFRGFDETHLASFGRTAGSERMMLLAEAAEKNRPQLSQFDAYGRRIDVVNYHESYHTLMAHGIESGCSAYGFQQAVSGAHVSRAALIYMQNQVEPGHCCPLVMTAAAVPVLARLTPSATVDDWISQWLPKILSRQYDPSDVPISQKAGVTVGMSMTEKQGGSDVRANTTRATPLRPGGSEYELSGHKWFTSAPMSDGFLTLAQTGPNGSNSGSGLSCFLVPRWLPDGDRNVGLQVQRLKDKLGDRANASSEIEYRGAWGHLIGEEGKGVRTIIEMVQSTRLDCALGSAGTARRGLQIALNHANSRSSFGSQLIQQPLMRNLLSDLCIEAESQTCMAMFMARAFDDLYSSSDGSSRSSDSTEEQQRKEELFRVGVSVSKYFVTKRLPGFIYECMEVLGGNGYVEDFPIARLFRQSPLNSIWEGSGNVVALDIILRAHRSLPVLLDLVKSAKGRQLKPFDEYVDRLDGMVSQLIKDSQSSSSSTYHHQSARWMVDQLAVSLQSALLILYGDPVVAELYVRSRLPCPDHSLRGRGVNYGGTAVFEEEHCAHLIGRSMPVFMS